MLSPEIQIFIQAIKSELMGVESAEIGSIDFDILEKKLWFHSVRPVLHQFFKTNYTDKIPEKVRAGLTEYVQKQTFLNLSYAHEISRLLAIFREAKLRVLPYKGILFVNELYGNKQLREVGDIDFLFHPDSAAEGMKILLNEGYQFDTVDKSFDALPVKEFIETLLSTSGQYEVTFQKDNVQLDFHWGLYHGHFPFKIDIERFFKTAVIANFYGEEVCVPDVETMFWMLLLHHGAKGSWLRLKDTADLIMFLKRFERELDWPLIFATAREYKMKKSLVVGLRLLKKHFGYPLVPEMEELVAKFAATDNVELLIENYWTAAVDWDLLFPRLRMENLFMKMRDEGFSRINYLRGFYRTYAKPNPLEHRRIVNFPDNYPTLNFISKVVTYILRKFR